MGIGQTLKRILHDKNMTIKQLSEVTGISINTLYSITKRDSVNVRTEIIEKIAKALDVPVERLLTTQDRKRMFDLQAFASMEDKHSAADPGSQEGAFKNYVHKLVSESMDSALKNFVVDSGIDRLVNNYDKVNTDGKKKILSYSDDIASNPKYTKEE